MTWSPFNPSSPKKYFFSTSWLLVTRGIRIFILFLVWTQVTRYLGPENFGILSYAASIISIFSIISNLGLEDILVKELAEAKENNAKKCELLGTALGLRVSGAVVLLALTSLVALFFDKYVLIKYLIMIMAASYLFSGFEVIICYFKSIVKSKPVAIVQISQTIFTSGIKYGLILISAPLIAFAGMMCLESFVLALGLIFVFQHQTKAIQQWKFNRPTAINLLKKSWPLILSTIAAVLYIRIDQIMIKHMLNNTAIGHYAAAVRIFETLFFIPIIISSSLLPAIVNSRQISQKLYMERFQNLYDLMAVLAVMVTIIILLFSNQIINLVLGPQYRPAINVLRFLSLSGIFVFLNIAAIRYLLTENSLEISLWATMIGSAINITLNMKLIAIYGIYGAAIATIISQGTGLFLLGILKKDKLFLFSLIKSATLISPFKKIFNSALNRDFI